MIVAVVITATFSFRALSHRYDDDSRSAMRETRSQIVDLTITWTRALTPRVESTGLRSWWGQVRIDRSTIGSIAGWVLPVRVDRPGGFESPGVVCDLRARIEWPDLTPAMDGLSIDPPGARRRPLLVVPHPGLISMPIDVDQWPSILAALPEYMRSIWRSRVDALADSVGDDGEVVSMILTGAQPRSPPIWLTAARSAGVGHMFAVSGLHLGLIAGGLFVILGRHRRWVRLLALTVLVGFSLGVAPSPSIWRALATTIIATLCFLSNRRPRGESVIGVAVAVLLWFDPAMVDRVAFQLSVIATLGLIVVGPVVRRAWFGRRRILGDRLFDVVVDPLRSLAAASVSAWLVTIPIVACHFGSVPLVSVPATIVVAPVFIVVMAMSLLCVAITTVVPDSADVLGVVLEVGVDVLVGVIESIGAVSPSVSSGVPIGLAWVGPIAALVVVGLWSWATRRWWGRAMLVMVISSPLILGWIAGPSSGRSMTTIDVGDGTAIVIQSGPVATIYDVGSLHRASIGRRVVAPTLRALGVRRIQSIIISHPNRDHFSGAMDLVRLFPVDEIVISPQFLEIARGPDPGSAGQLLFELAELDVPLREVVRGDEWSMEGWWFRVIHPSSEDRPRRVNDGSIVIDARGDGGWPERGVMLCGDIQRWGMAMVMSREPETSCDVMEVPHHGSRDPMLVRFIRHFDPDMLVQSTGERRYRRGRLESWWWGRVRRITCRDGTIRIDESWTSEESEPGFEAHDARDLRGPGPDDHDRPIDRSPLGERRDQHPGHALEKRRGGDDPYSAFTEVERSVPHCDVRLEVPVDDHLGIDLPSGPVTPIGRGVGGRPLGILSSDHRFMEHDQGFGGFAAGIRCSR